MQGHLGGIHRRAGRVDPLDRNLGDLEADLTAEIEHLEVEGEVVDDLQLEERPSGVGSEKLESALGVGHLHAESDGDDHP